MADDTIMPPSLFQRTWNTTEVDGLVGLQLSLPGRVFITRRSNPSLSTPAAEVVLRSNASDLIDLITVHVVNGTYTSTIHDWKMQVSKDDPILKLSVRDTSTRVQGTLLVHIILNSPVRSVSTSAQTILGHGTLLDDASAEAIDIAAYGNENVWIESTGPVAVKGLTLNAYGSGNIQYTVPHLTLGNTLDLNVFGIGSVVVEAAEAFVDSVESTVGGQGSIFVHGKYAVADMASHILGSGSINYYPYGKCGKSKVDIVGVGNINAGSWVCLRAHASVLGSGKAIVQVVDVLDVSGIGRGHIEYFNETPSTLPRGKTGLLSGPRVEIALINTYQTFVPLATPPREAIFVSVGPANAGWFLPSSATTSFYGVSHSRFFY
ncbi:hypothetical protein SPRG_02807 [Saprolegnia parasitica CBS 223.65]|uniref:Putative auto-transporter adhesin head GIN domain-containing protein n=1 Tax=Saprolegnia parasitica (strain CBS 223.65) TaxID=695850 RepID=A0A067CPA9_SAPPC|nr:hypothetical protein SPRG_02807 [Saprolegnia parasitica CBS 223.65]KDO32328.1 hypothetical protein SPRG_02807 [Saprolegnia parasitica CBS 223.65]|eukprot:XP_012196784.1 hypothetical protein SPRG_02807 [Saprolegnia parasitica CBS 223.65]